LTRRCIGVFAACAWLAACTGPQSALDVHGASAIHLKQLIIWIVAVCSLVWMLVMAVLIWALLRKRSEPQIADPSRERRMTRTVVAATVATVVIISGFTLASFVTTRAISLDNADLTVVVRGQQWWWELSYLDPDPSRSFKTANEIHIPVGRNVKLQLESIDVIHSFWVPSLAGKLDLIPGRTNELNIRAERAGVYRGQCAEFCGMQHTHMSVFVIADEPAAFEAWMEAQRRPAPASADAEINAGRAVFLTKPCAACHTVRGTDATGTSGPDLTHLADRKTIAAGAFDTTRGTIAAWIADPQTLKPGNNMPMVPMSSDELRQLSAYMMSLK
jgi:cytochrome c oxidase subunit 2